MAGGFKFRKKNPRKWRTFERALRKSVAEPTMRKYIKQANQQAGLRMAAGVRQKITEWDDPANAPLTEAIKGDNSPLVDSPSLWGSITSKLMRWNLIFIGVLRSDRNYNVAAIVHEGAQVQVTTRMATMFLYLFWASKTGNPTYLTGRARELWDRYQGPWPMLKEGSIVNIPPRRFIDRAFDDSDLKKDIMAIWQKGIEHALRELAR